MRTTQRPWKKVEEVQALLQQAQDKIEVLEAELIVEKATVTAAERLVKKKDEEIQIAERDQSTDIEKLQEKCTAMEALEAKVIALEKVNSLVPYKLYTIVLIIILELCFNSHKRRQLLMCEKWQEN